MHKRIFTVKGMSCKNCELKIKNGLEKTTGVIKVISDFVNSNFTVDYDDSEISEKKIKEIIIELGYSVENVSDKININNKKNILQNIIILIIIFGLYLLIKHTIGFNFIPEISSNIGYGFLFIIGFLTSFHCLAMCGGINISQCISYRGIDPIGKIEKIKH